MSEGAELEARLDAVTIEFIVPLRLDKTVDPAKAQLLIDLGAALGRTWAGVDVLDKNLVAKALFVFAALLTEADYAKAEDREQILNVAWGWHEQLRRGLETGFGW